MIQVLTEDALSEIKPISDRFKTIPWHRKKVLYCKSVRQIFNNKTYKQRMMINGVIL
jgi:hypothetical protein